MKIHVAHILVAHKYEADDILKKLVEGKDFEEMARKHSTCPSNVRGGDLGSVDSRRLDPDFAEVAEALAPQKISPVTRTRFGYHIIKRLG